MSMGRVEFRDGRAIAYDELGRQRTEKQCDKLVGYGPKGFVGISYTPTGGILV